MNKLLVYSLVLGVPIGIGGFCQIFVDIFSNNNSDKSNKTVDWFEDGYKNVWYLPVILLIASGLSIYYVLISFKSAFTISPIDWVEVILMIATVVGNAHAVCINIKGFLNFINNKKK